VATKPGPFAESWLTLETTSKGVVHSQFSCFANRFSSSLAIGGVLVESSKLVHSLKRIPWKSQKLALWMVSLNREPPRPW